MLVLEVRYAEAAGLRADFDRELGLGGLYAQVEGGEGQPPFAEVTLRLIVGDQPAIDVAGRLTVATAQAVCVEILAEARPALAAAVEERCAGAPARPGRLAARLFHDEPAPDEPPRQDEPPPQDEPLDERAAARLTLERKLLAMSVSEKVQLALHGTREERALLLRDRAGVVQASLVRNPRVTLDELAALARAPHLGGEAAQAMAAHPSWGSAPQVVNALVRNPRTPLPTALLLISRLETNDLRAVAKGLGVRAQVAQAARKRLLER